MTIGNRLKEAVSSLNINQTEFARQIGISPGNISDLIKGRVKPSSDTLAQIFNRYHINIAWLLTGKGSMFIKEKTHPDKNHPAESAGKLSYKEMLPVLNEMADFTPAQIEKLSDCIRKIREQ